MRIDSTANRTRRPSLPNDAEGSSSAQTFPRAAVSDIAGRKRRNGVYRRGDHRNLKRLSGTATISKDSV